MNAVKDDVIALAKKELDFANTKFPLFTTTHHGAGVIREEVEEVGDEYVTLEGQNALLWRAVKENNSAQQLYAVNQIYDTAIKMAVEAIQVAAMARKFVDSLH